MNEGRTPKSTGLARLQAMLDIPVCRGRFSFYRFRYHEIAFIRRRQVLLGRSSAQTDPHAREPSGSLARVTANRNGFPRRPRSNACSRISANAADLPSEPPEEEFYEIERLEEQVAAARSSASPCSLPRFSPLPSRGRRRKSAQTQPTVIATRWPKLSLASCRASRIFLRHRPFCRPTIQARTTTTW